MRCMIIIVAIQIYLSFGVPDIHPSQSMSHASNVNSSQSAWEIGRTTLRKGFMSSIHNVGVTYRKTRTIKGNVVHSFLGIQYGNDPTKLRFKKSTMYKLPWNNLTATTYGKKCPQMKDRQYDLDSSENCLTLNVYTNVVPTENTTGTIPVMVFNIGGGNLHVDPAMYKPDVLLDYNIILVTFQYRLGALGFFSLNNKDVPGNAGLSDHILALLWVQNNIGFLGGDKNQVTIVGQGLGAQVFSSLLFYKKIPGVSQQLFHAAIFQSGSALEKLAVDIAPQLSALRIAKANFCANFTLKAILTCMKQKPVQEITSNMDLFQRNERQAGRPGVTGTVLSLQTGKGISPSDKLVFDLPGNIARNISKLVNVPVMIGVNKNEGSYYFGGIYWSLLKDKYDSENYLRTEMIPDIFQMTGIFESTKDLAEVLRNDYIGDGDIAMLSESSLGLIDLTGTLFVKSAVWRTAQLMASVNTSFFYAFDFESKDSLFDTYFQNMKPKQPFEHGVTQGDELMYLFNMPEELNFDKSQNTTRDRLATLWTNFAIYHNPTPDEDVKSWSSLKIPKWEPIGEDKNYLLIEEACQIENDYMTRRHITRQPIPLPTQEEYDLANYQRQAFMICMIIFLLTTVALGGLVVYHFFFNK